MACADTSQWISSDLGSSLFKAWTATRSQSPAWGSRQTSRQKRRLDELCAELYPEHDLKTIQSWILQGKVTVKGRVTTGAGTAVPLSAAVSLNVLAERYVARAGFKLEAALSHFALDVQGKHALDAGVSTGGFTDCLLQHGAASVVGVDVGYAQVAEKVRSDDRVQLLERTNLRYLALKDLPGQCPVDIVTLDLSFISLLTIIPAVCRLLVPGGTCVTLIKPQFEAARHQVAPGGIVSDPSVHQSVVDRTVKAFERAGFACRGVLESPIRGAVKGNIEFLACFMYNTSTAVGVQQEQYCDLSQSRGHFQEIEQMACCCALFH